MNRPAGAFESGSPTGVRARLGLIFTFWMMVLMVGVGAPTVARAAPFYTVQHCDVLRGATIPASSIGLPTRGAQVLDANYVAADALGNQNGAYCRIVGKITAVQDSTPDIRFEVNLPLRWNGRSLQIGGGGYSGVLVTGTEPTPFAPSASPLQLGYATFGSDSGHVGNAALANFALNDEAVINFGYAHLKKTRDVAMALIQRGYGRLPDERYFAGGSTGGREALTVIERFPDDYDGVIANAPAINFTGVRLIGVKVGEANYKVPDGVLTTAQQKHVLAVVDAECDGLDGLRDGIVSNIKACRAHEPKIIAALRCSAPNSTPNSAPAGATAPDCLNDDQIRVLETLRDGLHLPYALAHGVDRYDGYNVFAGTDMSSTLGLGNSTTLYSPLRFDANGYLFAQADGYMKYFVTHDPEFDTLNFDVDHPGDLLPRLSDLSSTVGAMNPDFSAFIAHGGKLIVMHGLADEVISPNETIRFYKMLVSKYGKDIVNAFMRLYMVPGFQHGNGVFIPAFDELTALDKWVSTGAAPETLIGSDISQATNNRKRPLCRYPAYPRYLGHGNVNRASSFTCAMP